MRIIRIRRLGRVRLVMGGVGWWTLLGILVRKLESWLLLVVIDVYDSSM